MYINAEKNMTFLHASLRYFKKDECHVKRLCSDDVILFVFEGVLRFSENGTEYEVHAGEYYIQQRDGFQDGKIPSDSPQYFYIHCKLPYCEDSGIPKRGTYDVSAMKPLFYELDSLCHQNSSFYQKNALFYSIMSRLEKRRAHSSAAENAVDYLKEHYCEKISLDDLSRISGYSKNQIINIFKKEYNLTPFEYLLKIRIENAKMLMEVTSDSLERISELSGFGDYSAFYKYFVRAEKVSPRKWREKIYKSFTESGNKA